MKTACLLAVMLVLRSAAIAQDNGDLTPDEQKFLFDRAAKNMLPSAPEEKFGAALKFFLIHKDGAIVIGKSLCDYRALFEPEAKRLRKDKANSMGQWGDRWATCYDCYIAKMSNKPNEIPDSMIPELIFAMDLRKPPRRSDSFWEGNGRLTSDEIKTIAQFGKKASAAIPILEWTVEYSKSDSVVIESQRAIKAIKK